MSEFINNCTGVILAGGENTRMPVLKSFIEVDGKTIIKGNIQTLGKLFEKNFIVTNQPEFYAHLDTPMLGDIYDIRGPMTGIFTALLNSSTQWIFVSACDMPFINRELITYMAGMRGKHDAVVPESPFPPHPPLAKGGNYAEPLFAFYSRSLLFSMEKSLLTGKKGLKDFLTGKKVKYINSDEVNKLDAGARSFINLNTPEDVNLYLHHRIY
ncbi:MAG: molybdenum cofactor guanylyltransferase [Nitrospirae bacterium]|nr:molybdenum cofactor guanylyltransferase [Nitrospirota bacterium]